jgi:NAD(P)-dependent dehydrogenase (short-subunit alcohol dehydrogenase family)
VNLTEAFMGCRAVGPHFLGRRRGKVINISGFAARKGSPDLLVYSVAKAGLARLTQTLALEWARHNINVNCVAPGATRTRMTAGIPEKIMQGLLHKIPLRRLADPEEIAAAHLFLVSDDAAYVTGQVLFVDGGISVGI